MKLIECFKESPYFSGKHTSYFSTYEEILENFKNKKITLVEIGVNNGGSLFMWKKYLGDQCKIIGIDNNHACKKLEKYGFEIFIGNQADRKFWMDFYNKVGKIDILIDDGGHTNFQQSTSLDCSIDNINDEGLIIIEDTHTSYLNQYGNPSKYSFINLLFKFVDKINHRSESLDITNALNKPIYNISFFESIAVLKINRKLNLISKEITNNKKTLNIVENKFFEKEKDNLLNFFYKYKNFRNMPIIGNTVFNLTKKIIIPLITYLRIKKENKKMISIFKNLSKRTK